MDIQTLVNYQNNKRWNVQFLGLFLEMIIIMRPKQGKLTFGSIAEPRALLVYYQGQEKDVYQTYLGALKSTYQPNEQTKYTLTTSLYHTAEQEYFDILAQYLLGTPSTEIGSENLGDILYAEGVGSQHTVEMIMTH